MPAAPEAAASSSDLADVEVQDQDGTVSALAAMAGGRRSVMAFFYTRCANPEKCSLTITRLGALRRRLDAEGGGETVNVLALTYDPGFDLPERLHSYGASRGLAFDDRTRLLRTTGDPRPVVAALHLGVGYGPSTVNQHALELAFLDARCKVETMLRDALWSEDDVVAALRGDPMRVGGKACRS